MELLEHKKEIAGCYLMHTAKVKTAEPLMIDFKPDVEILAVNAAIKAGYHPAGYFLYNPQATEIDECLYLIKWESAKSCS
ncbi:hypothetical protein [Desmospora activa]|uniref:Uncharacterized protein n=1 Tax=Desmospora activa DSM 45169 TaxID=1121389 RepID=A0A2T4Z8Z0_9BACL|nr:hypothetical protein [Desmospora activa]PTM58348.1 hypothetical protein C8J48_0930 [Desmospora activa DSM 45169]